MKLSKIVMLMIGLIVQGLSLQAVPGQALYKAVGKYAEDNIIVVKLFNEIWRRKQYGINQRTDLIGGEGSETEEWEEHFAIKAQVSEPLFDHDMEIVQWHAWLNGECRVKIMQELADEKLAEKKSQRQLLAMQQLKKQILEVQELEAERLSKIALKPDYQLLETRLSIYEIQRNEKPSRALDEKIKKTQYRMAQLEGMPALEEMS